MLSLGGAVPRSPQLGSLYFNPVRLRQMFQPDYYADEALKPSHGSKSKLDLTLDVEPSSRLASSQGLLEIDASNIDNLTKDISPYAKREDEDSDLELESTTRRPKKKKSRPVKKELSNNKDTTIEKICSKVQLPVLLGVLAAIILICCCCTLWLWRRFLACLKRCWPFHKKDPAKKTLFDVEQGFPYQSRFRKSKKPQMIETGIQDSRTSVNKTQDEKPAGCSPCCRKKKKKSSKKRHK